AWLGAQRANASWIATSDVIAATQSRWSRQIDRARRLWTATLSARDPSRVALGNVCVTASKIGKPASTIEADATHARVSPPAVWTPIAISVASITAATSRFIGLAEVVTRR